MKGVTIGTPIPTEMPNDALKPPEWVEGIGEPINACLLFDNKVDPTGWLVDNYNHNNSFIHSFINIGYHYYK